jgi:hypothetical protein
VVSHAHRVHLRRWQPDHGRLAVDGPAALAGPVLPHASHRHPEPFQIYVVGSPVPSDDHEMFLTLVYAEIEQRRNKTPPLEIMSPNPKKKHGGKKHQARCLEVLRWLHAEGDITSLQVSADS